MTGAGSSRIRNQDTYTGKIALRGLRRQHVDAVDQALVELGERINAALAAPSLTEVRVGADAVVEAVLLAWACAHVARAAESDSSPLKVAS